VNKNVTTIDGRGSEALPPSSSVWLSVSNWINMEIRSKGLRVIFRNTENKRSCEVTYKANLDKWHVKCFILEQMTTDLIDNQLWPVGDNSPTVGLPMLNCYDSLLDALEAFKLWTK
jgi:hypothetical protein